MFGIIRVGGARGGYSGVWLGGHGGDWHGEMGS